MRNLRFCILSVFVLSASSLIPSARAEDAPDLTPEQSQQVGYAITRMFALPMTYAGPSGPSDRWEADLQVGLELLAGMGEESITLVSRMPSLNNAERYGAIIFEHMGPDVCDALAARFDDPETTFEQRLNLVVAARRLGPRARPLASRVLQELPDHFEDLRTLFGVDDALLEIGVTSADVLSAIDRLATPEGINQNIWQKIIDVAMQAYDAQEQPSGKQPSQHLLPMFGQDGVSEDFKRSLIRSERFLAAVPSAQFLPVVETRLSNPAAEERETVRYIRALGLTSKPSREAGTFLIDIASDSGRPERPRGAAIEALGALGCDASRDVPVLLKLATETDERGRHIFASDALHGIREYGQDASPWTRDVRELAEKEDFPYLHHGGLDAWRDCHGRGSPGDPAADARRQ